MRMSGQRRLTRMTKEQEVPASDADNIPGLTMLGYGYDVFAAPYCDADHCNGEGSEPLLDLGAETSTEITAFGRKFRHPNRVQVLNEQPTRSQSRQSTCRSLRRDLSTQNTIRIFRNFRCRTQSRRPAEAMRWSRPAQTCKHGSTQSTRRRPLLI